MATPPNATAPGNDAFGGGTLTTASTPTAVSGSYGNPGAGGFPTPGQPQILSARNNSGSNVRIPYARLVPMRGRQDGTDAAKIWAKIPDISLRNGLNGREVGQEYDGLESAELAWILGRKMITRTGVNDSVLGEGVSASAVSAHALGVGYGPDRMQRLAYQGYMEAYFRAAFGNTRISLHNMTLVNSINEYLVGNIRDYKYLIGNAATVLDSIDVPYAAEAQARAAALPALQYRKSDGGLVDATGTPGNGLATGLFVMEKGPFLRGKVVEDMPVTVRDYLTKAANSERNPEHTMARNFGDSLAFEALYAQLRAQSFFDWSPDGMVLSKLESPAGDPYSSMEIDARQAQLYNVCVQGPAIAKTWTGDYRQQVMPLDRVFIAMVADVVSTVGGTQPTDAPATWEKYKAHVSTQSDNSLKALSNATLNLALTDAGAAGADNGDYETGLSELYATTSVLAATTGEEARKVAQSNVDAARAKIDKFFKVGADVTAWAAAWDKIATDVKQGKKTFSRSIMTNFRLKRVTSSYLTQYSHFQPGKPESRCGLSIGTKNGAAAADNVTVAAEYIIGAWHIGTVLDNAASRSTIGNTVRTAPASMAININVNIEWWSGDKLHRHYMDVAGQNLPRDGIAKEQDKRTKGIDVGGPDILEPKVWLNDTAQNYLPPPPPPPPPPAIAGA